MGEKIRDITTINISNSTFKIELNEPLRIGLQRCIHIQNNKFRLECSESDFIKMACNIIVANKKLHILKGIKND